MFDFTTYKQQLWQEYNDLFNRFSQLNDSYSVNCRLLHVDLDNSNWDSVGGSTSYWSKTLSQLNWKIYENVPLFQNAPAVTQFSANETTETSQSFTATIKFTEVPRPNDLLMFYDDPSNSVYRITDVNFHRTIEDELKIFECTFVSAPVKSETIYDQITVESHLYYNPFNRKLYDFDTWMTDYQPILDDVSNIVRSANGYFDQKMERYTITEYNSLIKDIKQNSKLGAVTQLETPFTDCDDSCTALSNAGTDANDLYAQLSKLKEITC